MKVEYSENEIKLFNHFGLGNLLDQEPIVVYRVAVDIAFRKNMRGVWVEALRRGYNAIIDQTVSRKTPEFEKLIECVCVCDVPALNLGLEALAKQPISELL